MSLICDSLYGVIGNISVLQQRRDIAPTTALCQLITQLLTSSHVSLLCNAVHTNHSMSNGPHGSSARSVASSSPTSVTASKLSTPSTMAATANLFISVFRLASRHYITASLPAASFLKVWYRTPCFTAMRIICHTVLTLMFGTICMSVCVTYIDIIIIT
jgi:hypothetical protein